MDIPLNLSDINDLIDAEPSTGVAPVDQGLTLGAAENMTPPDFVTILTSKGARLTKRIFRHPNGRLWQHPYENAKHFAFQARSVGSLEDLRHVIDGIGPQSCLILGRLKEGIDPTHAVRRLYDHKLDDGSVEPATIEDVAHVWLPMDIDSLDACDEKGKFDAIAEPVRAVHCIIARLPSEFQRADCVWQFTSSAGFKPGIRMRLYFWLSRPLTGAEMKAWLDSHDIIDKSIYTPVQPIYAAPPVIEDVPDPVPQRSGILYQSGSVIPPDVITVKRSKKKPKTKAKAAPSSAVGKEVRAPQTSSTEVLEGPEDIEFDGPETVGWAIELMRADVAVNGRPEIGEHSDDRTYGLIGKLRDGPTWGKSLQPKTIAELLKEHWAPHFDLWWLQLKANGVHRNDPGVGPAGAARLFGADNTGAATDLLTMGLAEALDGNAPPDGSNATSGASAPSSTIAAAPPPSRPPISLGSDVEIAKCVAQVLRQFRGEVLFDEGHFWFYDTTHWKPIQDFELRRTVHIFDGAPITGGQGRVRLGKARIDSVLHEMTAILARPDFFLNAPLGINCASGFITFSSDGEASLIPHDQAHCRRHVISGTWDDDMCTDAEQLFYILQTIGGTLLTQLLDGVFRDDPDAAEKRQLLAEVAGAVALGYGTKLRQPKALILEGKTAENGKSQVLDLLRGLLPNEAVASIPAAKMGNERFLVGLVGKHLNASDELSGADAIAGDIFKAAITGEPITGRDVYRSAVTFRPVAQHVFATNTLPSFKGGMDRGVRRRLLVLSFNRTIPEDDRVEGIGQRIGEETASQLLWWAVAGASRLIRQRGFTMPPSSKAALHEWLIGADPVVAWIEARIEIIPEGADGGLIKRNAAYDDFKSWAKLEGFSEHTLPSVNTFVGRLRAHTPTIKPKHTSAGNFLTGFLIKPAEGDEHDPLALAALAGQPRRLAG
jgi:putative DNA primase/helicase